MTEAAEWKIPAPLSTCDVRLDDRTVIAVRRHGKPSGPRLVLTHGNGLAVDLYYPFWSLLAGDFDLMVYDIRNHGWNGVGTHRDHNIPTLIADHDLILDAIARSYGEKPTVGVFHSLSTLLPLLSLGKPYAALVLFDPPLYKPGASHVELHEAAERTASMIRKRSHPASRRARRLPSSSASCPPSRGSFPASTNSWPAQRCESQRATSDTNYDAPANTKPSSWTTRGASSRSWISTCSTAQQR